MQLEDTRVAVELIAPLRDRRIKNLIIQGGPGVGKSTLIRELNYQFPGEYALTSTTGVSAINLGATTIHSLLKVKDTETLIKHAGNGTLQLNLERLHYGYKGIIIDEYSMLDATFLDVLFYSMKVVEEKLAKMDIAPMRIILVGDILQLPPVEGEYCFKAGCISNFEVALLEKVHRQNDTEFIEALKSVRSGKGRDCVDFFMDSIGLHESIDEDFPGPVLMPRNNDVEGYNRRKLGALPGESQYYYPRKTGEQKGEWSSIPAVLELKVGAPVIILLNKRSLGYMNGDLGKIVSLKSNSVEVLLERDNSTVEIIYANLENEKEDGKSKGTISFLPLRLGYSITYHKVQSMTLPYVQAVVNDVWMMQRNPGMLGMGLSRTRTPGGLRIVCRNPQNFIESCRSSPECLSWLSEVGDS